MSYKIYGTQPQGECDSFHNPIIIRVFRVFRVIRGFRLPFSDRSRVQLCRKIHYQSHPGNGSFYPMAASRPIQSGSQGDSIAILKRVLFPKKS